MLENLSPTRVFHFFEEIAAIPHGSGHTDAISEYCVRFAAAHGLACEKDALNNVLIRKPAMGSTPPSFCRDTWIWCAKRPPTAPTILPPMA